MDPLEVSGDVDDKQRQINLQKFKDPTQNHRLLILSQVGNAGLNLHEARFMIFADSVWSSQQEEQIIGRIYRQPNKQAVYVYFPRVEGTSDTILSAMADVKEKLLRKFMGIEYN